MVQTKMMVSMTADHHLASCHNYLKPCNLQSARTKMMVLRAGDVQQAASFNGTSWHQPSRPYLALYHATGTHS